MNSLVASALPGRVRLRGPVLRQARALAQARSALQAQPGVIRVQTNARVGSLLLHYDAATLPQPQAEALLAAAVQAAPWPQELRQPWRQSLLALEAWRYAPPASGHGHSASALAALRRQLQRLPLPAPPKR